MTEPVIYLLDTNIISALMKDRSGIHGALIRQRLAQQPNCTLVTSIVVQYELLYGLEKHGTARLRAAYEQQIQHLQVLPLDEPIGTHYARLRAHLERQGTPIGANDTLIAAHALSLGATLVSADTEFTRVPDLQIENWLQPS